MTAAPSSRWTDEQVTELCDLLRVGHSFAEVAVLMHRTRCAIAGRVERLRNDADPRLPQIRQVGRPANSNYGPDRIKRPADFDHFAARETIPELCERFGYSVKLVTRWRHELGVKGSRCLSRAAQPPEYFAMVAHSMTITQARTEFHRADDVLRRWAKEAGVEFRRPSYRRTTGPGRTAKLPELRDITRAGLAADHLRRAGPVYRCRPDGHPDPRGTHWRRGSFVLTDAEIIERAERAGWQSDAWRAVATPTTTEGARA